LRHRHHDAVASVETGLAELAAAPNATLGAELALVALRSTVELHADSVLRRSGSEALQHREGALRWLGQLHAFLSADGAATPPAHAALLAMGEAEFSRIEGSRAESVPAWTAAVGAAETAGNPYAVATARWHLAETLLSKRDNRAAAHELRQAHDAATELGAGPLLAELEALALRARVDLKASPPGGPAPTPSPGESLGLSDRELEVLTLVARGRTNRQIAEELFITEKTAGHHVSNILAKLEVANRLEAASLAYRAGLLDATGG
jgi:DNA-binding NarL/FixJ family response regulator